MAAEENEKKESFVVKDRRRFDMEGNVRASGENSTSLSGTPVESSARRVLEEVPGCGSTSSPQVDRFTRQTFQTDSSQEQQSIEGGVEGVPPLGEVPPLNFSSFVISLATQALMQLGHIKPPAGVELPVDKIAAQQTIDILSMLHEKTKGNLDKDEERLMDEVLHNLRLNFVKASRS